MKTIKKLFTLEKLVTFSGLQIAALDWQYGYRRLLNFSIKRTNTEKLKLLNYVSSKVYQHVSFDDAITILESLYVKLVNVVHNRHKFTISYQRPEESIDQYLQTLNLLARNCNFKAIKLLSNIAIIL